MQRQGIHEPSPFSGRHPRDPDQPKMGVPDCRHRLAHLIEEVLERAVRGITGHGYNQASAAHGLETGPSSYKSL